MAQLSSPRLRHYRTMTAICFVCNLPILSHQVGLVWQGGNGWDDLVREQVEESTIRQRLGGRRDSATQICSISPPTETQETSPPTSGTTRRRRSSLAQLTDILREWGGSTKSRQKQLCRRETLADLARSLPWGRQSTTEAGPTPSISTNRKRRESSADSGIRSMGSKSRRDSHHTAISDFRSEVAKLWQRRESNTTTTTTTTMVTASTSPRRGSGESSKSGRRDSVSHSHGTSRRGSGESGRSGRRDSTTIITPPPPKIVAAQKKRRDSRTINDTPYYRQEQRPSTSSTASDSTPIVAQLTQTVTTTTTTTTTTAPSVTSDTSTQALPPPTIITSSVTPPATSPTVQATTPTHPLLATRRDSTTQCGRLGRRDSRSHASPERSSKLSRLQRQNTAYDESCLPPGGWSRRGSQPTALSPDVDDTGRKARRDSLSPDSASRSRRDSRSHLSPDRSGERDISPVRRTTRRGRLRRQSTSVARGPGHRSPDSSSCSSRDPSPSNRPVPPPTENYRPTIRRQSTTEEILIARGFRRQSTTEEMIRCRNFRRQSSQSDDCQRYRGRRDSSAQILDGTIASMTVETSSTFFDSSTQTEPSPLYDNNHYHEECLRCNSCGLNLTGPNQKRARRFKNQILCDLHFADVALMECSDFMQQLRAFKPQSLGCAVARRKSSTTLIFPLPPQACSDEFCEEFPHNFIPTPGYWIECSRQKITSDTIWDESESEHEIQEGDEEDHTDGTDQENGHASRRRDRSCNDLYEDDEEDDSSSPRKKTTIEEQWEKNQGFELTSVEQETYEKYFYGTEHWNYFTNDEDLGPVILSIKQETLNSRDQFRILVRAISYTVHGLIPASCVFADRYNREEVVRSLGKEVNINPPLTLGQLPDTPEELLKLDQVFIKSELKVGVIYVKEGQYTEEEILDNNDNSLLFEEFLQIFGEKVRLKGFDKYKGGLDTVHDLTGLYSVYTNWRNIEIMFHVSTLLPYEKHDPQKLQRKRHIGNDIVCVVFLEADNTSFSPACIKSHFLHTFILVRTSPRIKRKPTRYEVSVVTRDEVGAYKPYLWEQSVFDKGPMFREWLLTKIVNGERASYSAPKFENHAETGQIPKPYRRGSFFSTGHSRS